MPENCEQNSCRALAKLEQEVKDIRERNGTDHKEFREQIQKIERDEARQEGKLDSIASTLSDLKADNKEIIGKLTPLTAKVDKLDDISGDVKKLDTEVEEIKARPGKKWESIAGQVVGLIVAAIVGMVLARIGLSG